MAMFFDGEDEEEYLNQQLNNPELYHIVSRELCMYLLVWLCIWKDFCSIS